MSSYFNDKYTPMMEFGHELFNEWSEEEWNRFDNYMIECIKIYLANGLIEMPLLNLDYRKLLDEIGQEMLNFFNGLTRNKDYLIKEVYNRMLEDFPELKKRNISQNLMTKRLRKYCDYYKLDMTSSYNGGVGVFEIIDKEKIKDPKDDLPF